MNKVALRNSCWMSKDALIHCQEALSEFRVAFRGDELLGKPERVMIGLINASNNLESACILLDEIRLEKMKETMEE
jgi:hypothetical protein